MRRLRLRWQCLTALAALLPSFASPTPALGQGTDGATITGVVSSDQAQPLMGANVFITELNISVGTNEQGRYTITVPGGRVRGQPVVVSVRSIGFVPGQQSITLNAGAQTVNFSLKADVNRLQEVDVTGVTALNDAGTPSTVRVTATKGDGSTVAFDAVVRIDTPGEADYYRNGGILQYVLRKMIHA